MALPSVERHGDTWTLAWSEHAVGMGLDRLRETSDGLVAEVTVESQAVARKGLVLGPVKLNILSSESQTRFANVLAKRVNSMAPDVWHTLVVQACATVAKQYRAPSPTIRLADIADDDTDIPYLVPGLIPERETTIFYGDGESAKSLLVLRIALACATQTPLPWGALPRRMTNVLVLDWETNSVTVGKRLFRLALDIDGISEVPKNIHYRGATPEGGVLRSLDDEIMGIRAEISRLDIGLVIIDSIGYAASGPLVEDQTARAAMNALRLMAPATRIVVAHVSNDTARAAGGKARPFGSAFFWNSMRSGIEIRKADDQPAENMLDQGLFHRKSNDGQHHRDIGLRVTFDGLGGAITFEQSSVQDVPELAERTSLSSRIRAHLRKGSAGTDELAAWLDVKEPVVRTTLGRMADVIQLRPGVGRGQHAEWGLRADA
jgi:hypothetical protein